MWQIFLMVCVHNIIFYIIQNNVSLINIVNRYKSLQKLNYYNNMTLGIWDNWILFDFIFGDLIIN